MRSMATCLVDEIPGQDAVKRTGQLAEIHWLGDQFANAEPLCSFVVFGTPVTRGPHVLRDVRRWRW